MPPSGKLPNPLFKVLDDVVGQLAARRHFRRLVADRRNQDTGVNFPRLDRGAAVAAGSHRVGRIEPQPATDLVRFGGMTLVTVLDEYRANPRLKKIDRPRA